MQTIRDLNRLRSGRRALDGKVAFVPTMGALHDGHLELIRQARGHADHVVASIFVNPLQFGPNEDFARYPRAEERDAALLAGEEVKLLWLPPVEVMYPARFATAVSVSGVSEGLDGRHRPGHFDGVATVVAKLFNQVEPDIALFGEKDWQQLAVIRRMVADLDMGIEIVGVPTSREADGLARSSRNAYLSGDERTRAAILPQTLLRAVARVKAGIAPVQVKAEAEAALREAGFDVDYVALVDQALAETVDQPTRILAAARLGRTRLIDNFPID